MVADKMTGQWLSDAHSDIWHFRAKGKRRFLCAKPLPPAREWVYRAAGEADRMPCLLCRVEIARLTKVEGTK